MLPDDAGRLRERGVHHRGRRRDDRFRVATRECRCGTLRCLGDALAVRIKRPGATATARLR